MSEESKHNIKVQLAAIEAFVASPAHASYLRTIRTDIASVESSILSRPPITEEDRGAVLMLYGERTRLQEAEKLFEDARVTLESRLKELELEQPKRDII